MKRIENVDLNIYVSEKKVADINNTFADVFEKSTNGFLEIALPFESLEQHDKSLLKEFAESLMNTWHLYNGNKSESRQKEFFLNFERDLKLELKKRGFEWI